MTTHDMADHQTTDALNKLVRHIAAGHGVSADQVAELIGIACTLEEERDEYRRQLHRSHGRAQARPRPWPMLIHLHPLRYRRREPRDYLPAMRHPARPSQGVSQRTDLVRRPQAALMTIDQALGILASCALVTTLAFLIMWAEHNGDE